MPPRRPCKAPILAAKGLSKRLRKRPSPFAFLSAFEDAGPSELPMEPRGTPDGKSPRGMHAIVQRPVQSHCCPHPAKRARRTRPSNETVGGPIEGKVRGPYRDCPGTDRPRVRRTGPSSYTVQSRRLSSGPSNGAVERDRARGRLKDRIGQDCQGTDRQRGRPRNRTRARLEDRMRDRLKDSKRDRKKNRLRDVRIQGPERGPSNGPIKEPAQGTVLGTVPGPV
ncbi:hypothetical protein M885DRAFT_518347 [Pelagophyceae sp. CCMP2097]|nr:hypothetical protein M885DRAFT_518347 [Pelagophyceae sp. CCMP2097]